MDPNFIKGNPLVFDKLKPELGGKVVKAVVDDMKRAQREAEEKAKRARKKKK
jgi:hypothetical protein